MIRYNRYKINRSIRQLSDPLVMPVTGESPAERLNNSLALFGTSGEQYVEDRKIPVEIADAAGVRFDANWNGRPAVIAPMHGINGEICSVHGRYLRQNGDENKMCTIGPGGGVMNIYGGLSAEIIIIVEGLFDALSLAVCGYASVATVGRKARWLPEICRGKTVFLAFDGNRPGDLTAAIYQHWLIGAKILRLEPPGNSKDWNTALVKRGQHVIEQCLRYNNLKPNSIKIKNDA